MTELDERNKIAELKFDVGVLQNKFFCRDSISKEEKANGKRVVLGEDLEKWATLMEDAVFRVVNIAENYALLSKDQRSRINVLETKVNQLEEGKNGK